MSKFCSLADAVTNCTDNCKQCLDEEAKESETMNITTIGGSKLMARWKYTLNSGSALREAIYNEDTEQVVKCLLLCYQELLNKLDEYDEQDYEIDIQDSIGVLQAYELCPDEEDEESYLNDKLDDFYDLCDELRAWIET